MTMISGGSLLHQEHPARMIKRLSIWARAACQGISVIRWVLHLQAPCFQYWTGETEADYRREHSGKSEMLGGFVEDLLQRPESPALPDEEDALIRMAYSCGRIEQAWGKSIFDTFRNKYPALYYNHRDRGHNEFREKLTDFIYLVFTACSNTYDQRAVNQCPPNVKVIPINDPIAHQLALLE